MHAATQNLCYSTSSRRAASWVDFPPPKQRKVRPVRCHRGSIHAPHRTAPHRTAPYFTVPYHTVPYHTVPYHTAPYRTAPHRTSTLPAVVLGRCDPSPGKLIRCPSGAPLGIVKSSQARSSTIRSPLHLGRRKRPAKTPTMPARVRFRIREALDSDADHGELF